MDHGLENRLQGNASGDGPPGIRRPARPEQNRPRWAGFLIALTGLLFLCGLFGSMGMFPLASHELTWVVIDIVAPSGRDVGGHLLNYMGRHDGRLPEAEGWCDTLLEKEGGFDEHDFNYGGARCCPYAMNRYAYEVEGNIPGDMVLLFESEWGWNQAGGPEAARSEDGRPGMVWVFLANGKSMDVPKSLASRLRWRFQDKGMPLLPDRTAVLAFVSLVAALGIARILWTCRTADRAVWRAAAIVGIGSTAAALLLGELAERLYRWGDLDYKVFLFAGGPVGLLVGIGFILGMARLRRLKERGVRVGGLAPMLGGLTGMACSGLIHGYMMIAYAYPSRANLLAGQLFGLVPGIILGVMAGAMLGMFSNECRGVERRRSDRPAESLMKAGGA